MSACHLRRRHDNDRSAGAAGVATGDDLHRDGRLTRPHRALHGPCAQTVPHHHQRRAQGPTRGLTTRAMRRTHRAARGQLLCPRLDADLGMNDLSGASRHWECAEQRRENGARTPPATFSASRGLIATTPTGDHARNQQARYPSPKASAQTPQAARVFSVREASTRVSANTCRRAR